jgi:transposase
MCFGEEGVILCVRLRHRRRVCSWCGQTGGHLVIHDRRVKRWRHLDLGSNRCVIKCELRRLECPDCGVHLEAVPWARPGAHHTRGLEDVVAWLAQQMAKTPIAGLLRIGWDTVGRLPLLQPHRHRPPAMTFTPNSTGAPYISPPRLLTLTVYPVSSGRWRPKCPTTNVGCSSSTYQ